MAADPSVYAQLGANAVQPVNPLAMQGQVANTANALLGVRQLQSQQAAGQAFQASINPDGTTNQTALLQNLKADPTAAMAAQTSAQAGQTLSSAEYTQHMMHLQYGGECWCAAPYRARRPNIVRDQGGIRPSRAGRAHDPSRRGRGHAGIWE